LTVTVADADGKLFERPHRHEVGRTLGGQGCQADGQL
jgi:hypothetical protein